jgi:outer membrane murein-binding lipoprotein Lpp
MAPEDDVAELHRAHDADINKIDRRIDRLAAKIDATYKEVENMKAREQAAAEHVAWMAQTRRDLQELVDGKRWATVTRQVFAWIIGALIGAVMLWEQLSPWLKSLTNRAP